MVKKDIIKINGETFKTEAFLVYDYHPAIGSMFIIDGIKYVLIDDIREQGRYVRAFTENDKHKIKEYEEAINILANNLKNKVDVERIIKENLKDKSLSELRVGIQILKEQKEGREIQEEHKKGCYHYSMHLGDLSFDLVLGTADDRRREEEPENLSQLHDIRI